MGTTLQHGIFLPAEGERNCYAGLASNWTILDGMIGGYSSHAANLTIHVTAADKEAWNGKADASALTAHTGNTTIHVTAEDKQTWNGKADSSALTAHTGDTTIHVTAEDKQAWNGKADASALTAHTGDATIHVTAEDKAKWDAVTSKADDSDVVHKSGNETVGGEKTFPDYSFSNSGYGFIGQGNRTSYILPEFTGGSSGLSIVTPDFNKSVKIGTWITDENTGKKVLNTTAGYLQFSTGSWNNVNTVSITPLNIVNSNLGTVNNKWKTFNGLEPSSLSLPSGDASNFIDISSYFANTGSGEENSYTASANGWIYLKLGDISGCLATVYDANNNIMWGQSSTGKIEQITIPILKGQTLSTQWNTNSTVIVVNARFIPCQGNV